MRPTLLPLAACFLVLLPACDSTSEDSGASGDSSPAGANAVPAREPEGAVVAARRPLTDADIDRCEAALGALRALGITEQTPAALARLRAEKERICREQGLTPLEYDVLLSRLRVAQTHLELEARGVAIPPEKEADCAVARRHRDRVARRKMGAR